MNFGSYLKSLRTSRHFSLRYLAQQAAISPRTLSYWESGTFHPRIPELDIVLATLKATEQERNQALLLMGSLRAAKSLGTVSEQKGIGPTPSGGDILRALRHRRHLPLEQVAQSIGVSTGTLSRWESGKVLPNSEQIPRLLAVLCASPQERDALIRSLESGSLFLAPSMDLTRARMTITTVETLQHNFACFLVEVSRCENDVLHDIRFLTFEAQAWRIVQTADSASTNMAGRQLLAEIYSRHAIHLRMFSRFPESAVYAHRALEMFSRDSRPSALLIETAIALATATVRGSVAKPRLMEGIRILTPWEEQAATANSPAHEAWLLSTKALYLSQAGYSEEALVLGQRACHIAEQTKTVELWLRQRDLSRILIDASRQQAEEALSLITDSVARSAEHAPYWRADRNLLWAEGLLRVGDKVYAQERLARAVQDMHAHKLDHLNARASRIARQC